MISKQLQDQLSLLIIRSSLKGKFAISQIAESNNITMMPALTLCLLEPNQPVPMKSLSTFMSCDPSNVTVIVEQLVSEGLVERKEATHDRRIKTVTLTEKGLALRDKFLQMTTSTRLPHLDQLTESETEQLIAILSKATATSATQSVATMDTSVA
jgi:DNA-binding MarR family transcriptional regulator